MTKEITNCCWSCLRSILNWFMFLATMNKGNNHPQFQLEDGKTGTLKKQRHLVKKLPSDPEEAKKGDT